MAMKKLLWFFAFLSLAPAGALFACPTCLEAVASQTGPAAAKLLTGYAVSIALLMAAPYLLFATIAFLIVRKARRQRI